MTEEETGWSAATARKLNSTLPFDTNKAILFVREVGKGTRVDQKDSGNESEASSEHGLLSGHEAKQFYEDVLSMPEQSSRRGEENTMKRRKRKKRRRIQQLSETDTNPASSEQPSISTSQAFRCAQDGDLSGVKSALASGSCDVNTVDQFHWTLLMCAAHAGHMHIVEHLLSLGAEWRDRVDKRGRSAADLARLAGHLSIACLIEASDDISTQSQRPRKVSRRRESAPDTPSNSSKSSHQRSTYYCEECDQTITESAGERHATSTLHQFSCQHEPKVHGYGIPQSNRGFQMMLRGGWDPDGGLGSNQEGQRYPVKTILKRDRLGFGQAPQEMSQSKARVTHFAAFDESAVKRPSERHNVDGKQSVTKKKDIVKAAQKERQWEVRMRRYMNAEHGYGKFC